MTRDFIALMRRDTLGSPLSLRDVCLDVDSVLYCKSLRDAFAKILKTHRKQTKILKAFQNFISSTVIQFKIVRKIFSEKYSEKSEKIPESPSAQSAQLIDQSHLALIFFIDFIRTRHW